MNVTRKNFAELLPKIVSQIKNAEFVSLDLEFTGLPNNKCYNMLDTREERYEKVSQSIQNFFVLQYGISIFIRSGQKYLAHTYNIFLSPLGSAETQRSSARKFEFLASTIDFLSEHNYDFNTTFSHGVRYLTAPEEAALKSKLDEKREQVKTEIENKSNEEKAKPVPPKTDDLSDAEKALMDEYAKVVGSFLETGQETYCLPPMNGYIRRHFYMIVKPQFQGQCQFVSAKNDSNEPCIKVIKTDLSDDQLKLQMMDEEYKAIAQTEGFLSILKAISTSKVPLVFHASELDLMLTMKQFFLEELPPTLEEFKSVTMSTFPVIYDTLLMARTVPLKKEFLNGNSLEMIYKKCQESPFTFKEIAIEIPSGFRDYRTFGGQCHEAGFDAFMTGVAFVRMFGYLHTMSKSKAQFSLSLPITGPFRNRIAANRWYDINHVSLDRTDKTPKRDHCFQVSFPAKWKQSDIYALFNVCGHIRIYWINETSAFVTIEDHAAVNLVKSFKESTEYSIQTYKSYKNQQKAGEMSDTSSDKEPTEKKRRLEKNGKGNLENTESRKQNLENTAMTKLSITETKEASLKKKQEVFTCDNNWE